MEALANSVPEIETLLSHGGANLLTDLVFEFLRMPSCGGRETGLNYGLWRDKTVTGSGLREWQEAHKPIAMLRRKNPVEQEKPKGFRKKKLYASEEDDHPNIWKMAYADFMTAMMTFFLVMWLVTFAAKEKAVQLSNYFNPIKFSDTAPFTRNVFDAERDRGEHETIRAIMLKIAKGKHSGKLASAPSEKIEEEALFHDPFGVLTQLASQAEQAMAAAAARNPDTLIGKGSSHDPFVSFYITGPLVKWITAAWQHEMGSDTGATAPPVLSLNSEAVTAGDRKPKDAAAPHLLEAETDSTQEPKPSPVEDRKKADIQKRAAQLEKEVAQLIASLPKSYGPEVTVKAVFEGVLISLTDGANFSMFKISSALPSPQLVLFLERLGGIVNEYPGEIIVRGHTDGRPYAGDRYGNWRLSVDRATMAYYMLLRGKVGDSRFIALNGYAERDLKNKADPLARENRRIEILIRVPELPATADEEKGYR